MHRNLCVPRGGTLMFLLALLACAAPGTASAQEQVPPPSPVTPVIVPLNGTVSLQMSTKKLIKSVDEEDKGAKIVSVQPLKRDPTTVLVTGLSPGIARIALTDVDNTKEMFEIIVQTDVQYLKYIIRRAVPAANIDIVPSANNVFILTGHVQRSEDVQIVVDAARSVVGDRIINALRVGGVMQVQLCTTIARVARSEARSMGFSFLHTGQRGFLASILSSPLNLTGAIATSDQAAASTLSGSPNILFGVLGDNHSFAGFLQALRNENLVKVLAEPKILTLSGQAAEFISGGEQAVPTLASGSAGGGAVSGVEFRPFGTTVRFLPIVMGNGKIYLEVEPQFTFPDPSNLFSAPVPGTNSVVFGRTTQRVRTSVIMEDGQTFAIGGMVFHSVNGSTSKVPILGDLPLIGAAFSTVNYTDSEEELIVLVTPRLVDALSCDQVPKCLPGQETRSPSDCELFLERILEAPRGPRQTFEGHHYVPAYRNGPTVGDFPCAERGNGRCDCLPWGGNCHRCDFTGRGGCGANGCGPSGCGNGGCAGGTDGEGQHSPAAAPMAAPAAPMTTPMPGDLSAPISGHNGGVPQRLPVGMPAAAPAHGVPLGLATPAEGSAPAPVSHTEGDVR